MTRRKKPKAPPVRLLSKAEEDRILELAAAAPAEGGFFASLEELFCGADGFGITTATPVQRAICRIIDGAELGPLGADPEVIEALGGLRGWSPAEPPKEVIIVAGVRAGKSMIAAATAIRNAVRCDTSFLAPGEIPRFSIVSLSVDNAKVVLGHLLGALEQPRLKPLRITDEDASSWRERIDESGSDVVGSVFLRHPSGRPVEIRVVAGKRAGGSLVSRWSAGVVFDEAPRMVGSSDAVVNYDDAFAAVRTRLLPGAQILSIGSPWQPYGPIYDLVQSEWGSPTATRVIIRARGPMMNPSWWTPERCEEIKRDPKSSVSYQTDVLAEFADLEESLFPQVVIAKATNAMRPLSLPFEQGHDYVAAMDPATRRNAWTLVVCDRVGRQKRVVCAVQWQGTPAAPLDPRTVLREAKEVLDEYRLDWAYTDQWAADAIKAIALDIGLVLIVEDWTEKGKVDAFLSLAAAMADGTVELPADPLIAKDLRLTKKLATHRGVAVRLVSTPDGRHCDYASSLARALFRWIDDEKHAEPQPGQPGYWDHWAAKQEEKEVEVLAATSQQEWWASDPWGSSTSLLN